jgi:hypothetical protein
MIREIWKFAWISACLSALLLITSFGYAAQTYYVDAANGDDANSGDSEGSSWQTMAKVSKQIFQPGDRILLKRGEIWPGHLEIKEEADGTADHPIIFSVYGSGEEPIIRRLTTRGDYTIFEHLIVDHKREGGDAVRSRGAKHCVFRNMIVRNGIADGIDLSDADGSLIDSCLVHHFLAGSFTDQADAHGIVATDTQGLIIRDTEVHHVSGDSFQADPGRSPNITNDIVIEDCYFWTGPLESNFNDRWFAGQTPGENAIDTKVAKTDWESAQRMRITVRNMRAHGWINDGFIGNRAAFNMKEKIEAIFDGVTVYNCEIAFRLRGSRGNANNTIINAVIHDCEKAIRAENRLSRLRIYSSTFGENIGTNFQITGGDNSSTWDLCGNVFANGESPVANSNSDKAVK